MKNVRKKIYRVVVCGAIIIFLASCVTHQTIEPIIKVPEFYPYRAEYDGLIVIADAYNESSKVQYLFDKDIRKRGVFPFHIIFLNKGTRTYDVSNAQIILFDEAGHMMIPMEAHDVVRYALRSTSMNVISYGLAGTAFIILGVPFALSAGISSYRTNKAIKEDVLGKDMPLGILEPQSIRHGFVFFQLAAYKKVPLELFSRRYRIEVTDLIDVQKNTLFSVEIPINALEE